MLFIVFLSANSSKARASRDHFFFVLFLFVFLFLSLDFHELWHSMMSTSFLTEDKQQWAMCVLGWVICRLCGSRY